MDEPPPKPPSTPPQVVEDMRQRLHADASQHQQEGWNQLWKERLTPWDLGTPTPALISELANDFQRNASWWQPPQQQTNGRLSFRTLVPGCGAGYDLQTLRQHQDHVIRSLSQQQQHHDSVVVGLDISPISLQRASIVLLERRDKGNTQEDPSTTTRTELVMGDFFHRDSWKTVTTALAANDDDDASSSHPNAKDGAFDLIFDYTFFCALPPTLRPAWGEQVSALLHPVHGRLLTFIFPILPDAERMMVGPPFPLCLEDYEKVLHPVGLELEHGPYESPDTVPARQGKEMVAWWKRRMECVT